MDKKTQAIIVFDGVCNLCNGAVNLILKYDKKKHFLFTPLQSETGTRFLHEFGLDPIDTDTILLVSDGRAYVKSVAVFEIIKGLAGGWQILSIFRFLPLSLRDGIYAVVARHRYRLFGKRDKCMMPTEALKERFIT